MTKKALWIFATAVGVLAVFLPSYTKLQNLREKNRQYELEVKALELKKAKLIEEERKLREDPVYLEKVAREKMGLVKEGEVIYQLTPPIPPGLPTTASRP